MKNNYIIVSDDKITIDNSIKKIISENKLKDAEILRYEYPDISIDSVLESLNTYNFLSSNRLIIYNNCSFLSKENDKSINELKKYLSNSSDNYLIMINDSLNEKKKLENVIVLDNKVSSEVLIKNNLGDCLMDNKTINYFVDYCLHNNEKILNELNKIKCYKISESDKNITKEDIDIIVMRDYDEDIFDLVNAIANRDKNKAFEIYNRVYQKEKDSVNIIASVSSQIRILYSVKVLTEKKYKQQEIATILGIKPYPVQLASEKCHNFSSKKLLYFLNVLADIDYNTKNGTSMGITLFEIFLLNL